MPEAPRQVVRFDFAGRLGKFERTPSGGLKIPAFIARTGILEYQNADGTVTREYRPSSEVVSERAWRSFEGAPVTIDHPADGELVTPLTWRQLAVGHVRNVRPDGDRVAADLVIEDAEAIARIERGELVETSAGYVADVEAAPGQVDGQPYDTTQRNIRGNHVAIGPEGWGRSGPSVALRLDAITAPRAGVTRLDSMTTKMVKVDGIPYEAGSESHLQAVEKLLERKDAAIAEAKTRHDGEIAKLKGELDELKGAKVGLESRATKAETELAETKKKLDAATGEDEVHKRVEARLALVDRARSVLGAKFNGKGEDDKPMADGDIMRACLDKAGVKIDEDDLKNDAIVRGAFLAATASRGDAEGEDEESEDDKPEETADKRDRKDGGVRVSTVKTDRQEKPVSAAEARAKHAEWSRDAWRPKQAS